MTLVFTGKVVPMAKVVRPEDDTRIRDRISIRSLAADILKNGLLHPPTVFQRPDGVYELLAGLTRFASCQELGWSEIPVQVLDHVPTRTERLKIPLAENIKRKNYTPGEVLDILKSLMIENGWSREQVAGEAGLSVSEVSKLFSTLDRLTGPLRERWLAGDLPTSVAYPISRAKGEAEQVRLLGLYERKLLDREGLEREVSGKGGKSGRGQKVTVRHNGWTLVLTAPGPIRHEDLSEFLRVFEKAADSAKRQGLPFNCIQALIAGRASAN